MVQSVNDRAFRLVLMPGQTPGERLKTLRTRLGWSLRDAARAAETVSYSTLRNLEQRVGSWEGVPLGTLIAVGRAYGLPIDKLIAYVLAGSDAPDVAAEVLKKVAELAVHPQWVAFPVYGTLDAGDIGAATPGESQVAYIPVEHLIRHGALRENVRVFHMNGHCMISDEVRRIEKSFAIGDYVAIDITRAPKAGEVVVAWWDERNAMIIKRHEVDQEDVVLHPLSRSQPSVHASRLNGSHVLGPVIWRGG